MKDLRLLITESKLSYATNGKAEHFSSYRGGGNLRHIVTPVSAGELEKIADIIHCTGTPYAVLGTGTNCLIKDSGYEGLVICTANLKGITTNGDCITCGSGETLPKLALYAAKRNLGGLEPLTGIPSSVGGAIFMNAGAYGTEIKDLLESIDCYDIAAKTLRHITAKNIPFAYRSSGDIFQNSVICSATFRLIPNTEVKQKTVLFAKERRQKQPNEPSLGCVFQNPIPLSAGYMIESVGLKGRLIGGAAISEKHANFIVNKGGGTAADYIALMELARAMVYNQFKIELIPEIKILG